MNKPEPENEELEAWLKREPLPLILSAEDFAFFEKSLEGPPAEPTEYAKAAARHYREKFKSDE